MYKILNITPGYKLSSAVCSTAKPSEQRTEQILDTIRQIGREMAAI